MLNTKRTNPIFLFNQESFRYEITILKLLIDMEILSIIMIHVNMDSILISRDLNVCHTLTGICVVIKRKRTFVSACTVLRWIV